MVENWEAYVLTNHSCFPSVDEELFLVGTLMLALLEKVNCVYLRTEFRKDFRRFLDEVLSTVLSNLAARSLVGQSFRCFCQEIIVGGDNYSALYFLCDYLTDFWVSVGWKAVKRRLLSWNYYSTCMLFLRTSWKIFFVCSETSSAICELADGVLCGECPFSNPRPNLDFVHETLC